MRIISATADVRWLIPGLFPHLSLGMGSALCGILAFGLLFARAGVVGADPTLEVRNLQVTFPCDDAISVRGQLKCSDLTPRNRLNPDSEVDVNVDFPKGEQGWSLLPDRFVGYYITHAARHLAKPEYLCDRRYYKIAETKKRFYNSTRLLWSPILDRALDESKDDGRWIDFNKTLTFRGHGSHYRVVIAWKLSYLGGVGESSSSRRFAHQYHWVVYGPFPWGTAPECKKPLVAKLYRPVFFTEQGAEVKERGVPARPAQDDEPSNEVSQPERGELVRQTSRPSQLDAVNASNRLEQKLAGWAAVERCGVHVTPRSANVTLTPSDDVPDEELAPLLAKASVETAYAMPWVGSIEFQLGGRAVTIDWDSVTKYVTKDLTLAKFCETWTINGEPLPAPESPD